MKKVASLLLVFSLLLSFAAFPVSAEEATTKLVYGSCAFSQDEWLEYDVIKDICTRLNIEMEFISYDNDTFSLMLAGGDMPDIIMSVGDYATTILNNNLAMNLYPLMEESLPNMSSDQYAAYITMMQGLLGWDSDELYFIAGNVGVENETAPTIPSRGYIVRWDYYKELGYPEINNDDDYLEVLIAMQELHPTADDGTPTFAIGVERSLGDMGGYRASFAGSAMSNPWTFGAYKFKSDLVTSELINGYLDIDHSSYWTDMDFYNKVYREGLFDIDSFTMTYDEYEAKLVKGSYMGLYYGGSPLYNAKRESDPDTMSGYVCIPTSSSICFSDKVMLTGNYPSNFTFISKDCENPDKAAAFLNELFDPDIARQMYSGMKGKYWDYDESGKPYVFDEALEAYRAGQLPWNIAIIIPMTPYCGNLRHPVDGEYYNLFDSEQYRGLSLNALQADYCDYYGVDYMGQALKNMVLEGKTIDMSNDRGQAISSGVSDIPSDIKRILDNCNNICERSMPDLILAETEEDFIAARAKVLAELEEAGIDTAWEWASNAWAESKALVDVAFLQAKDALK